MMPTNIHIQWFSLKKLDENLRQLILNFSGLPQMEQQRLLRLRLETDRLLSATGLYLIQMKGLGMERLERTAYHQPIDKLGQIHFNISHSGEIVVLATSLFPVGIDVERMLPVQIKDYHLVMTDKEKQETRSMEDFYALWTQKEAVIKALGHGFQQDVRDIERSGNEARLNGKIWHLGQVELIPDYFCTLASEHKDFTSSTEEILPEQLTRFLNGIKSTYADI